MFWLRIMFWNLKWFLIWFSCLLDALCAKDFRNDFRKTTTYRMYMFIFVCGILKCFQNNLCEARMRRSGVFSLTGFNPLLFFCVLLIVFFRYTDFSLDMSSAFWIPVRCISICDALLVGLSCIHFRALHRVYVGYECIWKSNIYLILSYFYCEIWNYVLNILLSYTFIYHVFLNNKCLIK